MKVIHLSTIDYGGAYKATERISEAMKTCGINSEVYVRTKTRKDTKCHELLSNNVQRITSKIKNFFNLLISDNNITSDIFGIDVTNYDVVKSADVIFLHWINSFISYHGLEKILCMEKPIVWVMHDMLPFTGGCHVDGYCGKFKSECKNCPFEVDRLLRKKIPERNFRKKKELISKYDNIKFVGPSEWIVDEARKSLIVNGKEVSCIHNPIDRNVFKPSDNIEEIKNKYGIAVDKKIILLGAMGVDKVKNKGFDIFTEIINRLNPENHCVAIFGNDKSIYSPPKGVDVRALGIVNDEQELAKIYSMADVFVSTSRQESFGYTVCEALACGTPVVAFDIGGYREQIEHMENGYLAKPFDIDEFVNGINLCLNNRMNNSIIGELRINNNYSYIGEKYISFI